MARVKRKRVRLTPKQRVLRKVTYITDFGQWQGRIVMGLASENPPKDSVLVPREQWQAALKALNEAEAILGGEYGDTYAILCEQMYKLHAALAAAQDSEKKEGKE